MFDLHVHTAPCVFPRLADDAATVALYEQAGFSGCVLKGHCEPTTGRAATCDGRFRTSVYGGIVLNASVGGFEPAAVAAALALGARIVWLPTLDAREHQARGLPQPPGREPARLACPPVDGSSEGAIRQILALVADADAVVATGHLSTVECAWIVRAARAGGVRRILLTHPTYVLPAMSPAEVEELCSLGAVAEITWYQLRHGGDAGALAALARKLGPERCVLSSDAGQPDSPAPPAALKELVERLVAAGLDEQQAQAMASETPERLISL